MKTKNALLFIPAMLLLVAMQFTTSSFVANDEGSDPQRTILVSGIDCSWKEASAWDATGKVTAYTTYTANYSACLPAAKDSCDQSKVVRCHVTDVK